MGKGHELITHTHRKNPPNVCKALKKSNKDMRLKIMKYHFIAY